MNPKISVICLCFNHEQYVTNLINSVLVQSEQDFELIIIDDASTDNTISEIVKINDARVKLIKHPYNKGPNAALNTGFLAAQSEYLVVASSDDMLVKSHLEVVLKQFAANSDIGAIYCDLKTIDISGNHKKELETIYSNKAQDRYSALRMYFEGVDGLLSPGMAIRKSIFEQYLNPLRNGILQTHDMQIHIQIALNVDVLISRERTYIYRVPSQSSGVSFGNFYSIKRCDMEYSISLDEYLKIRDLALLHKIFGDKAYKFGKPTTETIPYILGRLALENSSERIKVWGYKTIADFLTSKNNFDLLNELYGFEFRSFMELIKQFQEDPKIAKIKRYKMRLKIISGMFLVCIIYVILSNYILEQ